MVRYSRGKWQKNSTDSKSEMGILGKGNFDIERGLGRNTVHALTGLKMCTGRARKWFNIFQNKKTCVRILYYFAWKTHLHSSNRVVIKWLLLYIYIPIYGEVWGCVSTERKIHIYPIFGFSIFLRERPTSIAPTGWP